MESNIVFPTPATGILPSIAEHLQTDPHDAGGFLSVAIRLLRQKQLERGDVQAKLRELAARKGVAK